MPSKTIYTSRLIIRPLRLSDADDMYEYSKTDKVGPNAGWCPHKSIGETSAIITNMMNFETAEYIGNYAIVLKSNHKMIGTIELYNYFPDFKAELGYALNPEYWGNGYVPEAARALIEIGFEKLNLQRIEAGVFPCNVASQRVCEKIGMTKEGVIKKGYWRYDGIFFDKIIFGITIDEYLAQRGNK